MDTTTALIIQSAVVLLVGFVTTVYQAQKIDNLKSGIETQKTIIDSMEKLKSFMDVDDFKKHVALKLENLADEMNSSFKVEKKILVEKTLEHSIKSMIEKNKQFMDAWEELSSIAIGTIFKQFKTKTKKERDEYILKHYPKNADYFIGYCDIIIDKKIY